MSSEYDHNDKGKVKKGKSKGKDHKLDITKDTSEDTSDNVSHKRKKHKRSSHEYNGVEDDKKIKDKPNTDVNDKNCSVSINLNDCVNNKSDSFIDNIDKVNTSFEKHGNILNLQISFVLKTNDNNTGSAEELILNNFGIKPNGRTVNDEEENVSNSKKKKGKKKHKKQEIEEIKVPEVVVEEQVESVKVKKKKKKHKRADITVDDEVYNLLTDDEAESSKTKAEEATEAINQVLSTKKKKRKLMDVKEDETVVTDVIDVDNEQEIMQEEKKKVKKSKKKQKLQEEEIGSKDDLIAENLSNNVVDVEEYVAVKVSKKNKKMPLIDVNDKSKKLKKKVENQEDDKIEKVKKIGKNKKKKMKNKDPLVDTLVDEEKRLIYSEAIRKKKKKETKVTEEKVKKKKKKKKTKPIEIVDSSPSDEDLSIIPHNDTINETSVTASLPEEICTDTVIESPLIETCDNATVTGEAFNIQEKEVEVLELNTNENSAVRKSIKQELIEMQNSETVESRKRLPSTSCDETIAIEIAQNDTASLQLPEATIVPDRINIKSEYQSQPPIRYNVKQEIATCSNNNDVQTNTDEFLQNGKIHLRNLSELIESQDQLQHDPNTTTDNNQFHKDNINYGTFNGNADVKIFPANRSVPSNVDNVIKQGVLTLPSYIPLENDGTKYDDLLMENQSISPNPSTSILGNPGDIISNYLHRTIDKTNNADVPPTNDCRVRNLREIIEDSETEYNEEERRNITNNYTLYVEEKYVLRNLMIKVAFSIPKLHEFNIIFDEPTTDEIEHIRSSHPELSVDEFTQSEDDIIKLNFQYFCSRNRFSTRSSRPFVIKKYFKTFPKELRISFVKCIGRSLNNRLLCTIYKRFCELYSNHVQFTEADNEMIINYIECEENRENGLNFIADYFLKCYDDVKRHVESLEQNKDYYSMMLYKPGYVDEIINCLVQLTFSRNVYDLRRKVITAKIWSKVSQLFGKPPKVLKIFWDRTLYAKLFLKKNVDQRCFQEQLIHYFTDNRLYVWDTINWKKIESTFEISNGHKIEQTLLDLITYYVPTDLQNDFQGSLLYMRKYVYTERSMAHVLFRRI